MVNIGNDWDEILKDEFDKEYYQKMRKFLINEYRTKRIYPKADEIADTSYLGQNREFFF